MRRAGRAAGRGVGCAHLEQRLSPRLERRRRTRQCWRARRRRRGPRRRHGRHRATAAVIIGRCGVGRGVGRGVRRRKREQLEYPVARLGLARAVRVEGGVEHELDEGGLLQRREGRRLGLGGGAAVDLVQVARVAGGDGAPREHREQAAQQARVARHAQREQLQPPRRHTLLGRCGRRHVLGRHPQPPHQRRGGVASHRRGRR